MDLAPYDKRALVTGASDEIDPAVCRSLIAEGVYVLGCARRLAPELDGLEHLQLDIQLAKCVDRRGREISHAAPARPVDLGTVRLHM